MNNINDKNESKLIYERVDKTMKRQGTTIYALALKAEVSHATIYKWRDTHSMPSIHLLKNICRALDIKFQDILIDDDQLIHLDENEKEFFAEWRKLEQGQKLALMEAMKSMIKGFSKD